MSPQDFYAPAEAAAILGWTAAEMERAIEDGEVEAERGRSGGRIAWQEVAAMLTARCPQAAIEEALGREIASVMPELVRLAELRIRIPRYQVAMLAMLAEREKLSVDELVARHFLDLAACEVEGLARRIPGFDVAMRWPGGVTRIAGAGYSRTRARRRAAQRSPGLRPWAAPGESRSQAQDRAAAKAAAATALTGFVAAAFAAA